MPVIQPETQPESKHEPEQQSVPEIPSDPVSSPLTPESPSAPVRRPIRSKSHPIVAKQPRRSPIQNHHKGRDRKHNVDKLKKVVRFAIPDDAGIRKEGLENFSTENFSTYRDPVNPTSTMLTPSSSRPLLSLLEDEEYRSKLDPFDHSRLVHNASILSLSQPQEQPSADSQPQDQSSADDMEMTDAPLPDQVALDVPRFDDEMVDAPRFDDEMVDAPTSAEAWSNAEAFGVRTMTTNEPDMQVSSFAAGAFNTDMTTNQQTMQALSGIDEDNDPNVGFMIDTGPNVQASSTPADVFNPNPMTMSEPNTQAAYGTAQGFNPNFMNSIDPSLQAPSAPAEAFNIDPMTMMDSNTPAASGIAQASDPSFINVIDPSLQAPSAPAEAFNADPMTMMHPNAQAASGITQASDPSIMNVIDPSLQAPSAPAEASNADPITIIDPSLQASSAPAEESDDEPFIIIDPSLQASSDTAVNSDMAVGFLGGNDPNMQAQSDAGTEMHAPVTGDSEGQVTEQDLENAINGVSPNQSSKTPPYKLEVNWPGQETKSNEDEDAPHDPIPEQPGEFTPNSPSPLPTQQPRSLFEAIPVNVLLAASNTQELGRESKGKGPAGFIGNINSQPQAPASISGRPRQRKPNRGLLHSRLPKSMRQPEEERQRSEIVGFHAHLPSAVVDMAKNASSLCADPPSAMNLT